MKTNFGYMVSEYDRYERSKPDIIIMTKNQQDAVNALIESLRNNACPVNGDFYKKEADRLNRNRHRIVNGVIDGLHMQWQIEQIEVLQP